ncbi:MAG: ATP synthase F1 subunit delta [Actinomycetes bacterium]
MSDRTRGYAEAVVALATGEGALETVEDELLQIARAVDANEELRNKLTDSGVPVGVRLGVVETDLLTAAHPATRAALGMVIAGGRAGDLADIARAAAELASTSRGRELAEVHVAVPLDDAQKASLTAALERVTGKQLDLKVFVDPDVVGGVLARVGDTVIDGTLSKRLTDVKTRIGR